MAIKPSEEAVADLAAFLEPRSQHPWIDPRQWHLTLAMIVIGLGLGLSMQVYTLVVQNDVSRRELGTATAAIRNCPATRLSASCDRYPVMCEV